MYGGFDVFKVYLGIKLHFTTKSYDYVKYEGKVNCKLETFTKRNDRYFFHKLSKQYDINSIVDFFVANFVYDNKKWIGNLLQNDGREIYLEYRKRKESFIYNFRSDCLAILDDFNGRSLSFNDGFVCGAGQHPRLLRLLIQKKASFQTIIVFDHFLSFSKNWDKEITEKVVWPKISSTIAKLKPFIRFNTTECKMIMKEIFVNGV
tara:strand:- start:502 stop:1116 length:615 start_codon:yes stop_codon:yes gene_type:complete